MSKWIKITISFILIILITILYSRFIETSGFITKEYTLYENNLPTHFDGLKIVHYSDLHYKRSINESKVNSIIDEINLINADIVVFTGDLVDKDTKLTHEDYEFLTNSFSKINAKYGKYAILGNHDYSEYDEILKIYNDSNFKYLENTYDIIYNEKLEKIFIGGLDNVSYNLHDIDKTLEYFNSNNDINYKILLTHEPDISDKIVDNYDIDLILAGHSHNGQIRLPIIGAIYKPPGAKKYYDEYYKIDNTNLYISSGIGVSNINYRFLNKPSINFYRINKQ